MGVRNFSTYFFLKKYMSIERDVKKKKGNDLYGKDKIDSFIAFLGLFI